MKKNVGDLKMSLKQARKLYVLERLCDGGISNGEAATGWETSLYELLTVAERGIAASRILNARLGIGPDEDSLPERFFEPLPDGPFQGKAIGKEDFEDAKGRFFQIMGWDDRGVPTKETCLRLGLEEFLN